MNNEYEAIYDKIIQASVGNQLVVFIGAGMSNNFGFPTWNSLVQQMYHELTGKAVPQRKIFSSDELLRIPQALRNTNQDAYRRILKECFGAHKVQSSDNVLLDEIMKLKPAHIITTNFDTLIEKYIADREDALYKSHSAQEGFTRLAKSQIPYRYMSVINDSDMVTADANHLLLKIHGDVQHMDSLVLCEDDYLDYSDSHILMENFIKSLLINHTFLFVGYGVGDSNLKLVMKWVDNIVARRQVEPAKRKKHILLYTDKTSMDQLQKEYFEQKQIQVLEFSKLPGAFRREKTTEFHDKRGNRLLSMLRAIAPAQREVRVDDERLQEVFQYFMSRKVVHTWELTSVFGGEGYEIEKSGTQLRLYKGTAGGNLIEAIAKAAKRKGNTQLTAEAQRFMGKLRVRGYCYKSDRRKKGEYKITAVHGQYDDYVECACVVSDYIGLYDYIKKNKEYSYTEKAHWAMYVDNGKDAEKWLEKQWKSKEKMDLYGQLRFAYNAQQNFNVQQKYNVDFGTLWRSVPEIERKRQCILNEYMTGCADLYREFGGVSDKLRLQYSVARSSYGWGNDIERFNICRTEILDLTRALILNGFYITGLWACTYSYGRFSELMYAYADMILFLVSPECRQKPKGFQIAPWDIYILINLLDHEDLEKLLEKYEISRINLEKYTKQVLLESCCNILTFCERRAAKNTVDGHLSSDRIESCIMLMELVKWNKEELALISEKMFGCWKKVLPLEHGERAWTINTYLFYNFLKKYYDFGAGDVISPYAEIIVKELLSSFLKEDHMNHYSKIIEDNVEWYRDLQRVSELIDPVNHHISKRKIGDCWECYQKWYRGSVSWFLLCIYPIAGHRVQQEISKFADEKKWGMKILTLRAYIERGIISYSDEVENILLDACRRFEGFPENDRQRILNQNRNECPLTHILYLWKHKDIPSIEIFRQFKHLDPWFDFVCFPNEFDYNEFDVTVCYSWIEDKDCRGEAFEKNRGLLKKKFQEAIENGAEEKVKRIFYKYIE